MSQATLLIAIGAAEARKNQLLHKAPKVKGQERANLAIQIGELSLMLDHLNQQAERRA